MPTQSNPITYKQIAIMFDHSLLQPILTDSEIKIGCEMANEYSVATVCVKPYAVKMAKQILKNSTVKVSTVIGFPHGGHLTSIKCKEIDEAVNEGAEEFDAVVNIGKVLSEDWGYVKDEIDQLVERAHHYHKIIKIIFENCFLKDSHKEKLCNICGTARADFVKTSTGYGETGATDHDLELMRRFSPSWVQVKAAGGVRDFDRVLAVRQLGVSRIGSTSTKSILDTCKKRLG